MDLSKDFHGAAITALATGESRVYGLSSHGVLFALSGDSAAVELQTKVAGAQCIAVRRALLACGTEAGAVQLLRASTFERLVQRPSGTESTFDASK